MSRLGLANFAHQKFTQRSVFFFSKNDVISVRPVVKHMNLVDLADGMATYLESESEADPVYKCRPQ